MTVRRGLAIFLTVVAFALVIVAGGQHRDQPGQVTTMIFYFLAGGCFLAAPILWKKRDTE